VFRIEPGTYTYGLSYLWRTELYPNIGGYRPLSVPTPWLIMAGYVPCGIWVGLRLRSLVLLLHRCYCKLRSRRRRRIGLCPACGYDIRACAGRCSECGEPLAMGVSAT
jgi:hypothetical protein